MMEIKYTTIPLTQETFQLAMEIGSNMLQARICAGHRRILLQLCFMIIVTCILNILILKNFVLSSIMLVTAAICLGAIKYTIYKEDKYYSKAMECRIKIDEMLNHKEC